MSITDELRKVARNNANKELYVVVEADTLFDIANRIDEEHERETREQYDKGLNDGYDVGFASADDWDDDHADALREHGWVKLPVDVDGVPIHIGDVVIYDHDGVRTGTPETVKWIAMGETEVHITTDHTSYSMPSSLRHHHEPTVEDVLREFQDVVQECCDTEDTVAEYAERIREVLRDE